LFDGRSLAIAVLLANRTVAGKIEGALEAVGGGAVLRGQLGPSLARLKSWCELCAAQGSSYGPSGSADATGEAVLDVNTIPSVVCDLLSQLRVTAEDPAAASEAVAVRNPQLILTNPQLILA
jgi:hypothetical protein